MGQLDVVELILASGALSVIDARTIDSSKQSALGMAAFGGHSKVVQKLSENGERGQTHFEMALRRPPYLLSCIQTHAHARAHTHTRTRAQAQTSKLWIKREGAHSMCPLSQAT